MSKGINFLTSVIRPSSFMRATSYARASSSVASRLALFNELRLTPLFPDSYDDFEAFKTIITNRRVVFTSSWIDKWFGIDNLKSGCDRTEIKLKLYGEGDAEIALPQEVRDAYKRGVDPVQIGLDRFFLLDSNKQKLRDLYKEMTQLVAKTGLGYYKFENEKSDDLVGGGALAPISEDGKKVDIALHILKPHEGIGSFCLNKLLNMAFEERGVEEVWGSSIIEHPKTPTLCTRHGMIIVDREGMKYYYIDKDMWKATREKLEKVEKNPIAASTHYGKGGSGGGR